MSEPTWVMKSVVLAVHSEQLSEHGGESGIRDEGLLDSALASPLNLYTYKHTDLTTLAAAFAFGIIQNHPFIDGNKRTAFVTSRLFLLLNGLTITAGREEKVTTFMNLASGHLTEEELISWFVKNHEVIRKSPTKS